jgi:hypothetical protein
LTDCAQSLYAASLVKGGHVTQAEVDAASKRVTDQLEEKFGLSKGFVSRGPEIPRQWAGARCPWWCRARRVLTGRGACRDEAAARAVAAAPHGRLSR